MEKITTYVDINHSTSLSSKLEKDWYIPTIDYYIEEMQSLNDKTITLNNIDAANGIISEELYKQVLSSINAKEYVEKIKDLDIMDGLDLIKPIVRRYMGEFIRQPEITQAVLKGDGISLELRKKVKDIIMARLIDKFTKLIQEEQSKQQQENQGQPVQDDKIDYEGIFQKVKDEYYTGEVEKANNLLTIIKNDNRMHELKIQAFYYLFSTNELYFDIIPKANGVTIELIPPYEYYRFPNRFSNIVEDDIAGMRVYDMSYNDVMNTYEERMTSDQKELLKLLVSEGTTDNSSAITSLIKSRTLNAEDFFGNKTYVENLITTLYDKKNEFNANPSRITVYDVRYITKRKVGNLTYMNQLGQTLNTEVSDDYVLNTSTGDIFIEWMWIDEVFNQVRLHDAGIGIYLPPEPFVVQRNELDDVHKCSLPTVGISSLLLDYSNIPICSSAITFQALYKILSFKVNKEIGKLKGAITAIPESMLLTSTEFDTKERLDKMFNDNILIFKDSEVELTVFQAFKSVGGDAQYNYIKTLWEIRDAVKKEAWETVDMNPERFGEIDTRGGKGNTDQAITRMSTGSLLLFNAFDLVLERVYQAAIDYARLSYVDGINRELPDRNGDVKSLNITHEELLLKEIGIYVNNSQLEKQNTDLMKSQVIQAASQNGEFELAIKSAKSDNIGSLEKLVSKIDKANKDRQVQMEQFKVQIEQTKKEVKQMELDAAYKLSMDTADKKGQYDLLVAKQRLLGVMVQYDSFNPESTKYEDDRAALDAEISSQERQLNNLDIANQNKKLKEKPKVTK